MMLLVMTMMSVGDVMLPKQKGAVSRKVKEVKRKENIEDHD